MNLFVIAWNPSPEDVALISSEMHRMKAIFPSLDPSTLWSFSEGSTVFAASMHTADEAANPRIYVKQTDHHIVLYDGCMVDQSGCFHAYDAEALASHWDTLPDVLEGHYTVARIQKHPANLEIINDPLGVWQTYYLQRGNQWFISNSSNLLSRMGQSRDWDPLGLSLYLCWGWAGSDRTLRRDIRVMPAGQHWRWDQEASEPSRKTYFQRASLSTQRHDKLTPDHIQTLAAHLSQTCQLLTQSFPVYCPITAGRDSRLLAAILLQGEMAAQYFVTGTPENIDVQIGEQISKKFNLPFHIEAVEEESNDEVGSWIDAGREWVVQKDGLFSLKYFVRKPEQQALDHLAVVFDGGGGGIAKGAYSKARFLWQANSKEYVQNHLNQKLMWRRGSLLRKDAIAITEKYLSDFIVTVLDEGFSLFDIPDVLYTYERVCRWAGNNISLKQHENKFMPLCTRPFIMAAFSISAQRRYTHALHYSAAEVSGSRATSISF